MLEKIYVNFWEGVDKLNKKRLQKNGFENPPHIAENLNLSYGQDVDHLFDMYFLQSNADKKLPTIVHIHGAAYLRGVRELYREYSRFLAQNGFCVINVEYTSGHRKGFPTPVFDVYKFFEFAQQDSNISSHIDFDKIILSGDSSGGHTATLVANLQTNEPLKQQFGLSGGPDIKGVVLSCPMMGVYKFGGKWPKERFAKLVFKEYYNTPLKDLCHNLETITENFPPSFIVTSANDFIKIHSNMFTKIARQKQLYLEHYCTTTGAHLSHCSMLVFPYDYESQVALQKLVIFAKNVLAGKTQQKVVDDKICGKTPMPDGTTKKTYKSKLQRAKVFCATQS